MLLMKWYNSLYSELSTANQYDCCAALDCVENCEDKLEETLSNLSYAEVGLIVIDWLIGELLKLDRTTGLQTLRLIFRQIRRAL